MGNSDKLIGLALNVSEYSLQTTNNGGQHSNGTFSLMASRWLTPHTIIIGGIANLIPWGTAFSNLGKTYYGALTQYWGININGQLHQFSASGGLATGGYAPLGAFTSRNNSTLVPLASKDNQPYPFANASFNFTPNFSIAGDFYSKTYALGLGYNTYKVLPLSFMIFVGNLKHTDAAPTSTFGLRVATAFTLPSLKSKA